MLNNSVPQPLVSIVVPVYNGKEFLRNGYLQLSNQDYDNLEIIFIDNNSTDNTYELLIEMQKRDERVKVFKESKQGAGAARNKGIQLAKGDFIAFFDIDDIWARDRISKHVNIFNHFPEVDMVFSKSLKKYEDPSKNYVIPKWDFDAGVSVPPKIGVIWMKYFFALPGIPACTIRANAIKKVGGFPDFLKRGEDAAFLVKCGLNLVLFFEPSVLGEYIRHSCSTVSKQNKEMTLSEIYYYQRKFFYLGYIMSLRSNYVQESFDKVLASSLLDYCFDREKASVIRRVNLMKRELKDLKEKGWSISLVKKMSLIFFCFFPDSFARLFFRIFTRMG